LKKHIHVYVVVLVIMLFQAPFLLAKFGKVTFSSLPINQKTLQGTYQLMDSKSLNLMKNVVLGERL